MAALQATARTAPPDPDAVDLTAYVASNFRMQDANTGPAREEYLHVLEAVYGGLGFLKDIVYPRPNSKLFIVRCGGDIAGICAFTPVVGSSPISAILAEQAPHVSTERMLELTNFIVLPEYRGSIAVGYMLYAGANYAARAKYTCIAGIVRYEVLRAFVDFGVIPVAHEPLHLLGDPELDDFVIYYDTCSPEALQYMRLRAERYFNQRYVMHTIRTRYVRRRGSSAAEVQPGGGPS